VSRAEEPADPGDWMVSVRGIAEDEVDRERQQEHDQPRDLRIQNDGHTLQVLIDRIARSSPRES
jgi:hypothetical protein